MTERVTIPILAERIETVDGKVANVDRKVEKMTSDFNAKFGRVYALQGMILVSIISGIVVALVTR